MSYLLSKKADFQAAFVALAKEFGVDDDGKSKPDFIAEEDRLVLRIKGPMYNYSDFLAYKLETREDKSVKKLVIQIDSYGGYIYDGLSLYDQIDDLREDGWEVSAKIMGMCYSAATLVAIACGYENIKMTDASDFMVHCTRSIGFINENRFGLKKLCAEVEKDLDRLDSKAIKLYVKASELNEKEIREYMEADEGEGTFFNSDELQNFFLRKKDKKGEKPESRMEATSLEVQLEEEVEPDPREIQGLKTFLKWSKGPER